MSTDSQPEESNNIPKNPAIKSSDDFDKEMEDFFAMREAERSLTPPPDTYKVEKEWDSKESSSMSGCCMTGCHNCPWGYKIPSDK